MNRVVLDSSAVLALLKGEAGSERVEAVRDQAVISAVNVSEVVCRLLELGWTRSSAQAAFLALELDVADLGLAEAFAAADLRQPTRAAGLSLGDRICLALALREKIPALTADRAWSRVAVGVQIELVR